MRIWDIPVKNLCKNHLLGEHRELHAIWSILTKSKKGYSKHPEVLRWKENLTALYLKHEEIVKEIKRRGYSHKSLLDKNLLSVNEKKKVTCWQPIKKQFKILKEKNCNCKVKLLKY